MSKRPLGHGDIRGMKDFKATAADYAYYLTLGTEGRLYCLTDRQIYCLLVQLDYVGWLTRWYNTADITQTTVGFIRSELEEALLSCVDISILVDQANENLITTVTNRAIQSQTLRDIYADEYTGSPTSINPSAPTTTWSYDNTEQGDTALCAALMGFVYQFARSQADSVRAGQVGGLIAVSLIAALLIPGLNIFFIVGAAIAVTMGLGAIGVTTEVAIQALTDTTALDAVVCCMKDNLKDELVSEATWLASLGDCSFGVGSHEQIVADFLGATLASNYLTFLDFMGTGYVGAGADEQMPACPCADPPPDPECVSVVFNKNGWDILSSIGTWVSGQGFKSQLVSGNYYLYLTHPAYASGFVINKVVITWSTPVTQINLAHANSSAQRQYTGAAVTTMEFSAATIAGWTNLNSLSGLRTTSFFNSGMTASTRVTQICVYAV